MDASIAIRPIIPPLNTAVMANPPARRMTAANREVLLSRREVEGLIADGKTVIVVDGKILKVDAWLKYHPGGDKAIMHMVGRDATDEVRAYVNHSLHSTWLR